MAGRRSGVPSAPKFPGMPHQGIPQTSGYGPALSWPTYSRSNDAKPRALP
jgi:hypothetical protein